MMWLEVIIGWFVGSLVLAAVAGKLMAEMSRLARDTDAQHAAVVRRRLAGAVRTRATEVKQAA